ncbi:MAG: GxxExxY protein [Verrucomicrobiales bacterium]
MKINQEEELPHIVVGARKSPPPRSACSPTPYRDCLAHELRMKEILFKRNQPLPIRYKELAVECAARVDFIIENMLILEVDPGDASGLIPRHSSRKLSPPLRTETSFLVNFNTPDIRQGSSALSSPKAAPRSRPIRGGD